MDTILQVSGWCLPILRDLALSRHFAAYEVCSADCHMLLAILFCFTFGIVFSYAAELLFKPECIMCFSLVKAFHSVSHMAAKRKRRERQSCCNTMCCKLQDFEKDRYICFAPEASANIGWSIWGHSTKGKGEKMLIFICILIFLTPNKCIWMRYWHFYSLQFSWQMTQLTKDEKILTAHFWSENMCLNL